jgi:hypothetical protein
MQECTLRSESDQHDSKLVLNQRLKMQKETHTILFSKKKGIHISFKKDD